MCLAHGDTLNQTTALNTAEQSGKEQPIRLNSIDQRLPCIHTHTQKIYILYMQYVYKYHMQSYIFHSPTIIPVATVTCI